MKNIFENKEQIKKVNKPWGYELWMASDDNHSKFALKEIFLNSGYKTSYQFHELKEECNYVISGSGTLLLAREKIDLDKFKLNNYSDKELRKIIDDLQVFNLSPGCSYHVKPLYVHAVISKNDLLMVEASTLHLDDVFRIFDESGRGHGRIDKEHS